MNRPHRRAVLQALFVTFLWSSSWVLIKLGLAEIPALVFAGLRYMLAAICLLALLIARRQAGALRRLSRRDWLLLAALGLIFYSVTQGAQFLGLDYLPAITTSLLLNLSAIVVVFLGIWLLAEHPRRAQWLGLGLYLAGLLVYFYPVHIPLDQALGLGIVLVGVFANAGASVLGRAINRDSRLSPLLVTTVSMSIGAAMLLTAGIALQGWPELSLQSWLIVGWLAVVNTAFAFTLWNLTLQKLSALESSIINNAMMIQIPILALLFLGERITPQQALGMLLAGAGIVAVQLFARRG
jgi:drug/metabolite transporter (DMT)-like permease